MRAPAVSFAHKLLLVAAVGLLACGLALPQTLAFAEGEDAPSVLLASSLMDGSASVVREDVALAAPEGDAAPEPVIGSFTVDGLTFAVMEGSSVQLVGVSPDWQQAMGLQAEKGSPQPSMPASGAEGSDADSSALLLPETVAYNGIEYIVSSIGAYAFYLSGVTSVELPASVIDVDERAFRSSDVASVAVAEGNPNYSSFDGALYDADQSSLLLIPEGKQGTVLLLKTAESAAPSVFSHCPLVTQVSVEEGSAAFASENGLLYSVDGTVLLRVPAGATDITIREGCTTIAAGAMEGCAKLVSIAAPATVASISPYLFEQQPEIVMAPVAVAAVEEDAEDDSADEGEPTDAAPQLSAMVALSSTDNGLPSVDASAINLILSSETNVLCWQLAGFAVEEEAPALEADSCSPAIAQYIALDEQRFDESIWDLGSPSETVRVTSADAATYTVIFYGQGGNVQRWHKTSKGDINPESSWDYLTVRTSRYRTHGTNTNVFVDTQENDTFTSEDWLHAWRTAYRFLGWSLAPGGEILSGNPDRNHGPVTLAGDTVIYANWDPVKYVITLNTNGGSIRVIGWQEEDADQTYTKDYTIESDGVSLPVPDREGYYFVGWTGPGVMAPSQNYTVPKGDWDDREYTANWEQLYTVTYSSAHGAPSKNSEQIRSSSRTVTLPTVPTVDDGYTFNGWKCSSAWGEDIKKAEEQITFAYAATWSVEADFTPVDYTVTLNTKGGSISDAAWTAAPANSKYTRAYNIETSSFTLPTPSLTGYTFTGWTSPNDTTPQTSVSIPKGTTGNMEYTANWQPKDITLTWDSQGGSDVAPTTQAYSEDAKVALPTPPTRLGYAFAGWSTDPEGGDSVTGATPLPTTDATYYAQWLRYSATFYADDEGESGAGLYFYVHTASAEIPVEGLQGVGMNGVLWSSATNIYGPGPDGLGVGGAFAVHYMPVVGGALHWFQAKKPGYVQTGWHGVSADGSEEQWVTEGASNGSLKDGWTYTAKWEPVLSVDVPIEVTAQVDLLGIEDQVPASGYIESRCGAPLAVEEVSFTSLAGAADLFGADSTARVSLQALALEGSASWDASAPTFSFPLSTDATESDASKLAALRMEGYKDHIPIGYRFAIPEDVLASIDPARFEKATTPVCSVVYTVALA